MTEVVHQAHRLPVKHQPLKPENRFRVAHISPTYGGVANAAVRLHEGLLSLGVDSTLFVTSPAGPNAHLPQLQHLPPASKVLQFADYVSETLVKGFGLTGMVHVSSLFSSFSGFDVLHFHGADGNWFNLNVLSRLARKHVLVWTMHDKHLGTGECGYPEMWGNCERWQTGCGSCPKAEAKGWLLDLTRFVYRRKERILSSTPMAIVSLNQWMLDFVGRNPITKGQILKLIPNGVNTKTFTPLPPDQCRSELKLPQNSKLVLYVAGRINEPRKGFAFCPDLLFRLRESFGREDLALVVVGSELPAEVLSELRAIMPVFVMGQIENNDLLARIYASCDVFLITSVIDNLPSVVLESLACGTPVAGFRVGGIPDMITDGLTGVLAELGDTATLASELGKLLTDDERLSRMKVTCRERAIESFSLKVQATKHVDLYRNLMTGFRGASPETLTDPNQ